MTLLMLLRAGIYVNLCLETKKLMDAKRKKENVETMRAHLLRYYDQLALHDDFAHVDYAQFFELQERTKGDKTKKQKINEEDDLGT